MTLYKKYCQQLSNYLSQNAIMNYDFLRDNNLLTIVEINNSPRATIVSKSLKNRYEQHNINIIRELKVIVDECNKLKITPVFVKGIVSVSDVYNNLTSRFIGDIDLYLKDSEIKPFLEILSKRNYIDSTSGITANPEWVERYKVTSVHMSPFSHTVNYSGYCTDIKIEIHIFPYFLNAQYGFLRTETIYNSFFNETDVVNCFGIDISAPKPVNYLVFLLDHVAKHLYSSLEADIYEDSINNKLQISLLKLFEAKVYFENHKKQINIDELLLQAKRCNAYMQVLCGIHLINELFPQTFKFTAKCETLLSDPLSAHKLPENTSCIEFCNYSLIDILLQSESLKKQLINDIFESSPLYGSIIDVPHSSPSSITQCANFTIDNYAPINRHGINIMHGQTYHREQFSLSGCLTWDEFYLYIQMTITDVNFPEENGNIITFHIGDGSKSNSFAIHLRVFGENKNFSSVFVKSDDGENDIRTLYPETQVNYIAHENFGYEANIHLPWSVINITTPKFNDTLEFDIELKKYSGEKLLSVSSIGCIRETYSSKYGNRIKLL